MSQLTASLMWGGFLLSLCVHTDHISPHSKAAEQPHSLPCHHELNKPRIFPAERHIRHLKYADRVWQHTCHRNFRQQSEEHRIHSSPTYPQPPVQMWTNPNRINPCQASKRLENPPAAHPASSHRAETDRKAQTKPSRQVRQANRKSPRHVYKHHQHRGHSSQRHVRQVPCIPGQPHHAAQLRKLLPNGYPHNLWKRSEARTKSPQ